MIRQSVTAITLNLAAARRDRSSPVVAATRPARAAHRRRHVAAFLNRFALVARNGKEATRMGQVNTRRVVRGGLVVAAILTLRASPAHAEQVGTAGRDGREVQVSVLGGTTRFSPPMRSVDDVHSMAN